MVGLLYFALPVNSIGIRPVAVEDRTETHFIKIFFVFMSASVNISSCVFCFSTLIALGKLGGVPRFHRFALGTLGPVTFGLGLRDSCLVILFFNLLCTVPPAYL
jgi:purine-cytosine permease-like protein